MMVAQSAPKAYRATLYDAPGTLGKVDGVIYFFSDAGDITEYEPEMASFTCVLGEIGLSECQALADKRHGGFAKIACGRTLGRN